MKHALTAFCSLLLAIGQFDLSHAVSHHSHVHDSHVYEIASNVAPHTHVEKHLPVHTHFEDGLLSVFGDGGEFQQFHIDGHSHAHTHPEFEEELFRGRSSGWRMCGKGLAKAFTGASDFTPFFLTHAAPTPFGGMSLIAPPGRGALDQLRTVVLRV